MPVISRFFGIAIMMYWKDHQPPHFHAEYGDHHAIVAGETGVVRGKLPPRVLGLVQEWRALHERELMEDWKRAQTKQALKEISPLE